MVRILYLLFVLSGAAGLIYEAIWTRYLGLFVGHDAYAQIAVLVLFLGGMSIGALVVSRLSERIRHPLYLYAAVELVVGGFGFFFHGGFPRPFGVGISLAGSKPRPLVKARGRQVGAGPARLLITPMGGSWGPPFPIE